MGEAALYIEKWEGRNKFAVKQLKYNLRALYFLTCLVLNINDDANYLSVGYLWLRDLKKEALCRYSQTQDPQTSQPNRF